MNDPGMGGSAMNCSKYAGPRMKLVALAIYVVLLAVFSGQTFAQAGIDMGKVTGTIQDPSGALVPKAHCVLSNVNTGIAQSTTSTSAGAYSFPLVPVGTYTLKISAPGFRDYAVSGIVVHLGSSVTEDAIFHVGATSAEVTVTAAAAPILQAQDASLGTTVDSTMVNELPISAGGSGRNVLSLLTTVAGAQPVNSQLINGVQSGALDVRLNGANNNAEVFGGQVIPPIPDAVEEFKVESGNNSADIGHSYGTVVNMVTKVGTNKLHGKLWEYNDNDITSANDYFNKRNQITHTPTPQPNRPTRLRENSFGALISGPVVIPHLYDGHNKTFFTADFQYTYYSAAPAFTGTVPTAGMQKSGFTDMSDQLTMATTTKVDGLGRTFQQGTMLDPSTTRAVAVGTADPVTGLTASCPAGSYCPSINGVQTAIVRDPYFAPPAAGCPSVGAKNFVSTFAGGSVPMSCLNQLPSNRLDPNAVALLKLFPAANQTNANGSYQSNYYRTTPQTITTKTYNLRIDHTFSEKDSAFVTFDHYNSINQMQPQFDGVIEGGDSISFWTTVPSYMVVLTENHVFNSRLFNSFRVSKAQQYNTRLDPADINTTYGVPAKYGIAGIPQTTSNGGLPRFAFSSPFGAASNTFGSRQNDTWQKVGSWQVSDGLTKVVGRHEWKFGGEYNFTFGDIAQVAFSRGNFSYNGVYSNVPGSGDGQTSLADFLLVPAVASASNANYLSQPGNVIGGASGFNGNNWAKSTYHAPYIAGYVVDNWKITPMLTASLGMRWDYFGPYYANGGQEANFWMGGDGNQPNGSAYYVGHDGCASTMSSFFKNLLAYDNIPIICEPNNAVNHTPKGNWSPRASLAYRVRSNLVVRGGVGFAYGAFNSIGYAGTLGQNYPFRFNIQNGSANNAYTPQLIGAKSDTTATMESTFSNIDMTNANAAYLPLGSLPLYGKPYHFKVPYVITPTLAVQYQFTSHDAVEVRYVGSLGRQLESGSPYHNAARELLTPSTTLVTLGPQTGACAPYCATSPDNTVPFPNLAVNAGPMENTGQISAYHSGQVEYTHQFGLGFSMDTSYTYASCLSDGQGGQQNEAGPGNGRAPWVKGFGGYRADYDRCSNTSAQVFKTSGEYALPFGKGAHWANNVNTLTDGLIGGWKLDPIWFSASGTRMNVTCQGTVGGDKNNAGFTGPWFAGGAAWSCNAPLVYGADPYKPGPGDLARTRTTGYLNSAAFTAPASPVLANGQLDFSPLGVRGNQIVGPGWYNFDLAAHKSFAVYERAKLDLVAQSFNVFNHAEMNNPGTGGYTKPNESLTTGFGTITGTRHAPRTWEFAAKLSF
jgi:hypothetical protein